MHKLAVSVIFLLGLSLPLAAQQPAAASPEATHFDFSGGLSLLRSNAPPGTCGCFHPLRRQRLCGAQFEFLARYRGRCRLRSRQQHHLFRPQLVHHLLSRWSALSRSARAGASRPFAQVLFGDARGSGTLLSGTTTPVTDNAFALTVGGGVDYALTRRWSVRGQVEYMQTRFPNEVNNRENNLRISFGAVYHLGGPTSQDRHHHWWWP